MVSGPGGVGKDTIVSEVLEREPGLRLSRSWTTRAKRAAEGDHAYCFVDRATFEDRVGRDGFLEWVEYMGNLYGTPLPEDDEGDVILVIEVQGAGQVLEKVPGAKMILIVPPSRDAQAARMRARGDDEEHIAKRLAGATEEEDAGRRLAHHVVVNDDLDRAVGEVAGILAAYRASDDR